MRALLWPLFAATLAAQTVTVTGIVTNVKTNQPIEGVSVVLSLEGNSFGTNTDLAGRFLSPKVKEGRYRLRLSRTGYESVLQELRITAGASPPPLQLTMLPWPALRGIVLDPDRQPVPRARVQAINLRRSFATVPEATTSDTGHFSLENIPPGQWRLLVLPPNSADPTAPRQPAPTWFPAFTDQRDAPPITLAPGDDLSGYDITLLSVPVFRISGTILDDRGDPAPGATIETALAPARAAARAAGAFTLLQVRPGEALLRATWRRGEEELRGSVTVDVGGHDLQDITIRLALPVPFSGVIELNSQSGHPCEGTAILTPANGQGERLRAQFTETGILFPAVYPGRYRLQVQPGWTHGRHYLDSLRLGPQDITTAEFDITPGTPPFRVLLASKGGHLRGSIENGTGGIVVLAPKEESLRFPSFIVTAFFEGATFALDNVRPGDYLAFALKGSFNTSELQDPAYARPFLEKAQPIRIERDATATATLTCIPVPPDR